MEGLEGMSVEQLEAALKKKKEAEKAAEGQKKADFEKRRQAYVDELTMQAEQLSKEIAFFHQHAKALLLTFREDSRQYAGMIRANSKGGYSIETPTAKAVLKFQNKMGFDERATLAEELINDFLTSTVKKRDLAIYELLMDLLKRDAKGKLEPQRVMEIIKHEDRFEDERWTKAIKLLKESYQIQGSKYYMEFSVKDEDGKWQLLNLNFSAL